MKREDLNAAGRAKYQQLWDVTAQVIRAWDPHGLLAGGSPVDEFDHEITSLVAQIPRIHSAVDAAHAVSRIFGSSFEPNSFTREKCSEVGKKLYAALSEQGLIDGPPEKRTSWTVSSAAKSSLPGRRFCREEEALLG